MRWAAVRSNVMADCPKCLRIRKGLDSRTPGWCPLCRRWQLLRETSFEAFPGGRYRHLACIECKLGAWCRDFWSRPTAIGCAREGHVEDFDAHSVTGEFKPKDPRR